jgi:hypothetical protein
MPKATPDLRSLARAHTELAVQTLAGIARNGVSEQARVGASEALLNRGWGRPAQVRSDEGDVTLQVIIRTITDVVPYPKPVTIEHDDGGDGA